MACFLCGSFRTQAEDDPYICSLSSPSPKKTRQKRNMFHTRVNKNRPNPYSDRGLDKFEALLEELDQKRQKIFTQKGAEDVSMVKFIYKSPNDEPKPIIVKFQDHRKHDNMSSIDVPNTKGDNLGTNNEFEEGKKANIFNNESTNYMKIKFGEWWDPSYIVPLFVILILVLLLFSGRSFVILCISIGWYLVPIINETLYDSKQPKKIVKKEQVKKSRPSEK